MKGTKVVQTDASILQMLQKNGRATINDISEGVGLSPSPVARRVKLLEEAGIIGVRFREARQAGRRGPR